MAGGVGLDVGTNMIVSAIMDEEGKPIYKKQRDAFFRLSPKSEVNRKSIEIALKGRNANFIIDGDDFIVVGEDALYMANERNMDVRRPMSKGILSPKEKASLPMIKLIIKSLIGEAVDNEKLTFSVPAEPIDGSFDIYYHKEMMKTYIKEMGFKPEPLNEGFAIAFAELLDDNLTGMCLSFGAGMINLAVVYEGDPIVELSVTKGGDWIDQAVANALDYNPSFIQIEKEESKFDLLNPEGKIQQALAVYYNHLINYSLDNIIYELKRTRLPSFRKPIPIILSGGLVMVDNFTKKFKMESDIKTYPFEIKEIRQAEGPMTCVARGCLMAAIL